MSLLTIGSAAYDSLDTPFGKRDRALGGSGVYASFAASFFTPSRLVAIVGEDWKPEYTELLSGHNVDVEGLEIRSGGKTMFWSGRYEEDVNVRETLVFEPNVMADYKPLVPESYKDSPYVFLGNGAPDAGLALLDAIATPKLVVADTMDFYIHNTRSDLDRLIARINGLILNDSEAALLTGVTRPYAAAREILKMGPEFVVVKRGEYGAFWMSEHELYLVPAYPTDALIDPTGAGDVFAGALMGCLSESGELTSRNIKNALLYATVVASLNIEGFSLERFKDVRREDIEERVAAFRAALVY
ncbi:MAG: PfkB family carbohydrate kinase [Thermoguttaceae bacterium]|jgi:sugar/nucleoside kinase (ribokinase family)